MGEKIAELIRDGCFIHFSSIYDENTIMLNVGRGRVYTTKIISTREFDLDIPNSADYIITECLKQAEKELLA